MNTSLPRTIDEPVEISTLAEHRRRCSDSLGIAFRVQCAAEGVHAFLAPRLVTTICLSLVVFAGAAYAF